MIAVVYFMLIETVDQQAESPGYPHQDSIEPHKTSTRIPPRGFDRPEFDEEMALPGDMMKTTQSRSRRESDGTFRSSSSKIYADLKQLADMVNVATLGGRKRRNVQTTRELAIGYTTVCPFVYLKIVPILTSRRVSDSQKQRISQRKSKSYCMVPFYMELIEMMFEVLKVLWTEPVGGGGQGGATYEAEVGAIKPSKYKENAYHSVRRFVVASNMEGHSICL